MGPGIRDARVPATPASSCFAERAQPQRVELEEAGGVAMIVGNRALNARAFQLLSLSSLKMGEPSPLDSKPVSE
jgi:hypothetical protein